jgi:hypothetical protein
LIKIVVDIDLVVVDIDLVVVNIDLVVVDIDLFVADIDFVVSLNETEDIRLVDVIVSFFEVVIMLKSTFDVIC